MTRMDTDFQRKLHRPGTDDRYLQIKRDLHARLIGGMNLAALGSLSDSDLRRQIRQAAEELCRMGPDLLALPDRERLVSEVLDETFGLGPLEPLMRDPTVADILVNGPKEIYVERQGKLEPLPVVFRDQDHLMQIVQRILGQVGRRVDESQPLVDARLPDGSRINVIIAPLALDGPLVSIRRFGTGPLRMSDLVGHGSLVPDMAAFLEACVRSRLNLIVSGGTGSGKTTLLGALSGFIPDGERVVTIEDAAELKLLQRHVARLETRTASIEGKGLITTRDLVRNALRMRPDRIIVGECRGAEAMDMLQAMNTGHDGGMTTLHANDAADAVARLEMMVAMATRELPLSIIRRQIASALHLVVHLARMPGGGRKVVRISEIQGIQARRIVLQDLFVFERTGIDTAGMVQGRFAATGNLPRCLDRLASSGHPLQDELFALRYLQGNGSS